MTDKANRGIVKMAVASGITFIGGLVLYLLMRLSYDAQGFWYSYVVGLRGTGLMCMIFGLLWFTLTLMRLFTHFFDEERKLEADKLVGYMIAAGVVIIVALMLIVPRVPSTPSANLPGDAAKRREIVRVERNFKALVVAGVFLAGAAFVSVPFRRFMRH